MERIECYACGEIQDPTPPVDETNSGLDIFECYGCEIEYKIDIKHFLEKNKNENFVARTKAVNSREKKEDIKRYREQLSISIKVKKIKDRNKKITEEEQQEICDFDRVTERKEKQYSIFSINSVLSVKAYLFILMMLLPLIGSFMFLPDDFEPLGEPGDNIGDYFLPFLFYLLPLGIIAGLSRHFSGMKDTQENFEKVLLNVFVLFTFFLWLSSFILYS